MGARIPEKIREQVMKEWLEGLSRPKIARNCGIAEGSISNITMECQTRDYSFALQRDVALHLRSENLSVQDLARSIRLNKILKILDLPEEKVERLIEQVDINCFKIGLPPEIFIECINNVCDFAMSHQLRFELLPQFIDERRRELEVLDDHVVTARAAAIEAVGESRLTIDAIHDYERDRPNVEKYQKLKRNEAKLGIELNREQLMRQNATKQLDSFRKVLDRKDAYDFLSNLSSSVLEEEYEDLEELLGRKITSEEYRYVMDYIGQNPTKYAHIFQEILQQRHI
jgi:hypothetical protein